MLHVCRVGKAAVKLETSYTCANTHTHFGPCVQEEERSEALAAARAEEEQLKEVKKMAKMQDHKMAAIAAIRKAWESQKHDRLVGYCQDLFNPKLSV